MESGQKEKFIHTTSGRVPPHVSPGQIPSLARRRKAGPVFTGAEYDDDGMISA